jgi:23S rRNA (cytidine1920-2'-O)/16S rRNA (cytidine1409-2'-O)-methyltransferase
VEITIESSPAYVSRGGEKLEAALIAFDLSHLDGTVCVDVGSSTGGFTDCLLQHGAARVYAVDVGYGQLHWKLRNNPRVITMEKTNARFIDGFPEVIHLVTVDASFISLKILLPVIKNWLRDRGEVIALIKPQFEVGRAEAAKGEGVIRDPDLHFKVIKTIIYEAREHSIFPQGLIRSPLLGPKGNTEFLVFWTLTDNGKRLDDELIKTVFEKKSE